MFDKSLHYLEEIKVHSATVELTVIFYVTILKLETCLSNNAYLHSNITKREPDLRAIKLQGFSNQTELRVSDESTPFSNGCDSLLLADLW